MKRSLSERLLEQIDAYAFYSQYTKLSRVSGKGECKGLCPLHEEKTPSFCVNLKTGSFKCFGCGAGGGPIQFYAAIRGLTYTMALEELSENLGLGIQMSGSRRGASKRPAAQRTARTDPPSGQSPDFCEIYSFLLDSGRPLSGEVIDYFVRRRIRPETLSRFGVSFLQDPSRTAGELRKRFSIEALTRAGVFRKSEQGKLFFQFQSHPLLFPIMRNGQPVFVQGRIFEEARGRSKYCNLANVSVPTLFNVDRLTDLAPSEAVFVCEGAPDTLVLEQAGFPAVGVIGSSGFKAEWVEDLSRFKIYLALDNDVAGQGGAAKIGRLFHERNLPVSVVSLPSDVKDVNEFFLTRGASEFRELVEKTERQPADLCATVRGLLQRVADHSDSFSYPELTEQIYSWFVANGGVFVVNRAQECFLMFEQTLYEIGQNDPFNALMFSKTHLVPVQYQGRMVWQILRNLSFLRGRREGNLNWLHADEATGLLYINLHNGANQIVRLQTGRVDMLANGNNEANVMLSVADKMEPIEFASSVNPKESVELLKRLVMEPLACEPENKLFLCCWILTAFFLEFTTEKALLKLSGHTGSGKTTAARILSCLLYGADHVESATVAYYYADAARNPYLICDNLETENMNPHVIQFLLHVATGISKGKRRTGTDSEIVRETSNCLVAITAIEPLTKPELINRTYDVEFRSVFKQSGFMQREHLLELTRSRSKILSGLFQLFTFEVLPGFQSQRQEILGRLQTVYPQHSKQRVDSFLTIMIVILRALLKVLEPGQDRIWEIVGWWIHYQGKLAEETERDTNMAVYLLDGLAKEMLARGEEFPREYYMHFYQVMNGSEHPKEVSFVASARDLLMALQILSKNKGFKLPFSNTKQLGVRLANENSILEKAGWSWEREKVVHGLRYHRFKKVWS